MLMTTAHQIAVPLHYQQIATQISSDQVSSVQRGDEVYHRMFTESWGFELWLRRTREDTPITSCLGGWSLYAAAMASFEDTMSKARSA